MLDLMGTILVTTAIAVCLTAMASAMPLRLGQRLTFAGVVGAWVGVAAAVAAAGRLNDPVTILVLFALPLAVIGGIALLSATARASLLAIPTPLLIGLNAIRVGGVLFVLLALFGRLGGPFPQSAGWGDFLTGALAIPLAGLAARAAPNRNRLIAAWNAFGTLDLVVAVALGILSRPGSPLQLIHAGAGSAAMTSLPWSLVPTVLVPFFLFVHGLVFAQLRERKTGTTTRAIPAGGLHAAR